MGTSQAPEVKLLIRKGFLLLQLNRLLLLLVLILLLLQHYIVLCVYYHHHHLQLPIVRHPLASRLLLVAVCEGEWLEEKVAQC